MRTLHKYLQNQLSNSRRAMVALLLFFSIFNSAQAEKFTDTLSTLFKINKEATKNFKFLDLKISKSSQLKTDQFNYYINKDYLLSLLFRLPQPLSEVISNQKCTFLELTMRGLFEYQEVLVLDQVNKITKTISQTKALSSLVIPILYKSQCSNLVDKIEPNQKNLSFILKKAYLQKNDNYYQCNLDLKKFSNAPQFAKALIVAKKIKKNRELQKNIISSKLFNRSEIRKLISFYEHFTSNQKACSIKETLDISKDNYSHIKENFILPICRSKFKNNEDLKNCTQNFIQLKKTCMEAFPRNRDQLFPHQSCQEYLKNIGLSQYVLKSSSLKFYGESLKQSFRIFSILMRTRNKTDTSFIDFVNFLEKENELKLLQSSVCYQHKFLRTQKCLKTFFLQSDHYLAINNQVEKSLKSQKLIPKTMNCTFKDESEQINMTGIDSGCRISYLKENCYVNYCPFKIFINGKLLKIDFKVVDNFNFPFKNFSKKNDFNYFIHVLKRSLRLKETRVTNSTQVKEYLKNKKSVIYGAACTEDLLNKRFVRRSFSQCTPILFTVNGSQGNKIITQLSIENNNFLRSFSWDILKRSVENFSQTSDTNWSLYALKN